MNIHYKSFSRSWNVLQYPKISWNPQLNEIQLLACFHLIKTKCLWDSLFNYTARKGKGGSGSSSCPDNKHKWEPTPNQPLCKIWLTWTSCFTAAGVSIWWLWNVFHVAESPLPTVQCLFEVSKSLQGQLTFFSYILKSTRKQNRNWNFMFSINSLNIFFDSILKIGKISNAECGTDNNPICKKYKWCQLKEWITFTCQ